MVSGLPCHALYYVTRQGGILNVVSPTQACTASGWWSFQSSSLSRPHGISLVVISDSVLATPLPTAQVAPCEALNSPKQGSPISCSLPALVDATGSLIPGSVKLQIKTLSVVSLLSPAYCHTCDTATTPAMPPGVGNLGEFFNPRVQASIT